MYEDVNKIAAQQYGQIAGYGLMQDQLHQMTCGENLERKIAEQKERLAMLEAALKEMKATGLYDVKISTLRDTMTW